jgi:hypothetical protein
MCSNGPPAAGEYFSSRGLIPSLTMARISSVRRPRWDQPAWCTFATWENQTQADITLFEAKIRVPAEPATDSGQTIFLFNGLYTPGSDGLDFSAPVLQWGLVDHFLRPRGGPQWTVQTWCRSTHPAFGDIVAVSDLDIVRPGRELTCRVRFLGRGEDGSWMYQSEFVELPGTRGRSAHVNPLTHCVVAMDAVNVTTCSDYPAADNIRFSDIEIRTFDVTPDVHWRHVDSVTDCGQHTIIVNDSGSGGIIDVWFRELEACPTLRGDLAEARAVLASLQEELRTAAPPMKPFLVSQIRMWNARIRDAMRESRELGCRR